VIGTVGGFIFPDEWNGPKGIAESELTVNDEIVVEENVDTSEGISDLVTFLLILPITSAMSAAMIWFFILIGQFLYSLLKPIRLNMTDKGLALGSSIRLCIVGMCFSMVPLSLISTIVGIIEAGALESFNINDEPMGPGLAITLSLIFIPLLSVVTGAFLGVVLYIGQRVFTLVKPLQLTPVLYNNPETGNV